VGKSEGRKRGRERVRLGKERKTRGFGEKRRETTYDSMHETIHNLPLFVLLSLHSLSDEAPPVLTFVVVVV